VEEDVRKVGFVGDEVRTMGRNMLFIPESSHFPGQMALQALQKPRLSLLRPQKAPEGLKQGSEGV